MYFDNILGPFFVLLAEVIGGVMAASFMLHIKRKIPAMSTSEENLNSYELLVVTILALVAPILSQAIFYYGWKKGLPKKAKSANLLGWVVLALLFLATRSF